MSDSSETSEVVTSIPFLHVDMELLGRSMLDINERGIDLTEEQHETLIPNAEIMGGDLNESDESDSSGPTFA